MIWAGAALLCLFVLTFAVWLRRDGVSFSFTVLPFWGGAWARQIQHDYVFVFGFWQLAFHSQDLVKQQEEMFLDARDMEFEAGRAQGYAEAEARYGRLLDLTP